MTVMYVGFFYNMFEKEFKNRTIRHNTDILFQVVTEKNILRVIIPVRGLIQIFYFKL